MSSHHQNEYQNHPPQYLICQVSSAKYLSVKISEDMSWNHHIDSTTAKKQVGIPEEEPKDQRQVNVTRPTKPSSHLEIIVQQYGTLTHKNNPKVWKKVQCSAARWIINKCHSISLVTNMINDLRCIDLTQRRVDSWVAMKYKVMTGLVNIPLSHYVRLQRDNIHIKPIHAREDYYWYSFFPHTASYWNALIREALQAELLATFKSKVVTCPMTSHIQHCIPKLCSYLHCN